LVFLQWVGRFFGLRSCSISFVAVVLVVGLWAVVWFLQWFRLWLLGGVLSLCSLLGGDRVIAKGFSIAKVFS
jgi:hypothetical protein